MVVGTMILVKIFLQVLLMGESPGIHTDLLISLIFILVFKKLGLGWWFFPKKIIPMIKASLSFSEENKCF